MLRLILVYFVVIFMLTGCQTDRKKSMNVIVANAKTEVVHSKSIGDYKITIYTPNKPTPKDGWPVIYLLDGDSYFLTAYNMMTNQACDRCVIKEGMIVAIDYSGESRRGLDYLPKPEKLVAEILPNHQINLPVSYGGADDFYDFLTKELKPEIEKRFPINPNKQAIFGHSYGGLFNLYAFLAKPIAFDTYIISSPSMWFSGGYMFDLLSQHLTNDKPPTLGKPVNLWLSVGGAEQSLLAAELSLPKAEQKILLQHRQNRKMVDSSTRLFEKLKQANITNLQLSYTIYPNQSHKTVAIFALQEGIQVNFNAN